MVTSDAAGNLAVVPDFTLQDFIGDMHEEFTILRNEVGGVRRDVRKARREARRGVAAAISMEAADTPELRGGTNWTANIGVYRGQVALGASVVHRFDIDRPLAMEASYGYAGKKNHGARLGMKGSF